MFITSFRASKSLLCGLLFFCGSAHAALSITPITWNVVGLDSNNPSIGPNQFPVAARVCALGSASNGPVTASFNFIPFTPLPNGSLNGDTACSGGPCLSVRSGTLNSLNLGSIPAGTCQDAYFEVEVLRSTAAFGTARRYNITADDASPGSISTPQPRELFVERLISQNRNSVLNVSVSPALALAAPFPTAPAALASVSAGGSFGLSVGNFYDIRLDAQTATQGYEQLETFANFSNAVFRVHRVESSYSADSSANISSPSSLLYADGCTWQLSPALPNYLGCLGEGKAGGTISTTYRIEVLQVTGGTTAALNTLIYDYSGSSFHYNADVGVGGRTIVIDNPNSASFSKAFSPTTIPENGISQLSFTIFNPNLSTFSGYNFVDPLPAGIVVANPSNASFSGCGAATFAPTVGATSLSFSDGTIAGNGTCVLSLDVTGASANTYLNVTNELFVGAINTGLTASATLTITDVLPPPSGTCTSGVVETLASWDMSNNSIAALASPHGPTPPIVDTVIGTPVARFVGFDGGTEAQVVAGGVTNNAWLVGGNGTGVVVWNQVLPVTPIAIGARYFEIELNTSEHINIDLSYRVNFLSNGAWGSAGSQSSRVYSNVDGAAYTTSPIRTDATLSKNSWNGPLVYRAANSGLSSTRFGMVFGGNGNGSNADDSDVLLDDIIVTGCRVLRPLTISKAFAPTTIGIGQSSTLTFLLTNPNSTALSGVAVSDVMPAGLLISSLTNTSCAGSLTQSPTGTVNLAGANIAANSTCSFQVSVTGVSAGLKNNVSNPVSSTQTGINTNADGIARATLLVLAPPQISKSFSPDPITAGTTSNLVFTIQNPNTESGIVSVAMTDVFPTAPGAMTVATPLVFANNCGGSFAPSAGAASVTLSGGIIAAGASCTMSVRVTVPAAGTYSNSSGPVSHVLNAQTLNGNNATDTLTANAPQPRIGLQKRISTSATGPWGEFASLGAGGNVYYQFTIENLGDVPLHRPASGFWITDPLIPGGPFCAGPPVSLPTANISDTHIFECVVGPIVANLTNLTNTATVTGDPDLPAVSDGDEVSDTDTASYTTKLPDLLVSKMRILPSTPTIDNTVVNDVTYRITVQNLGPSSTVNDTLAPIVVEDTLRSGISYLSFSASDPAWNCVQTQVSLDKVVCTFSGVLASEATTFFDLSVRVAIGTPDINNIAVATNGGDPTCNDSNPTPDTDCKGPYVEQTVPVTLSDVSVSAQGSELLVEFGTAIEVGAVSFAVVSEMLVDQPLRYLAEPVAARASGLAPHRYSVRGTYRGEKEIWIEELAIDGKKTRYGPYRVGTSSGDRALVVRTDWSSIGAEQREFRAQQAQLTRTQSTTASVELEIRVNRDALVRLTHEDLLGAGIDWSGMSPSQIALTRGSQPVALSYQGPARFGAGSELSFVSESVKDSLYTETAVYRLRTGRSALSMKTVPADPARLSAESNWPDQYVHAPRRIYNLSAPGQDPWAALRLVRSGAAPHAAVEERFVLPELVAGAERIEIELWGGLDHPGAADDHSVLIQFNGRTIATARWNGVRAQTVSVDLPKDLLRAGNNSLRLQLLGDTGFGSDVVYLKRIALDYNRLLKAQDNRLAFNISAKSFDERSVAARADDSKDDDKDEDKSCDASTVNCKAFLISGLTSNQVRLFRLRASQAAEQLDGFISRAGLGYELSFATDVQPGDRYWLEPSGGSASPTLSAVPAITGPLSGLGSKVDLLVISHPSFVSSLTPWIAARRTEGLAVGVVDVEDIYRYYNRGEVDPVAIQLLISESHRRLGTRYVVLVGGDSYDYKNDLGVQSLSFIPTFYKETSTYVSFAPTDVPFVDVDSDGKADLAIGRFPVRTAQELAQLIAKTLQYSKADHQQQHLKVSDRDHGGLNFEAQSNTVSSVLGAAWNASSVSMRNFSSDAAGLSAARAELLRLINNGQALTSYFGHSSPTSWTREGMLTAPAVYSGALNNALKPTVVWHLGCYGAYFVDPNYNTIAHGMLLQPTGAAAWIGTSALTEFNSDLAWLSALGPKLSNQRLGDAWKDAQRYLQSAGPLLRDVSIGGVLLGDPTLRINR